MITRIVLHGILQSQRLHPKRPHMVIPFLCDFRKMPDDRIYLASLRFFFLPRRLYRDLFLTAQINNLDALIRMTDHFLMGHVICAAPGRLPQSKVLIVADHQIKPACIPKAGGVSPSEHIHTVRAILDL